METSNQPALASGNMFSDLVTRLQHGDMLDAVVIGSILMMLLVAIGIIVERVYMILFVYNSNGSKLMQKVQRLVLDNNIDDAIKLCNSRKQSVLYQIFKAALVNAHRPFDEIQDHVEVAKLAAVPRLQKRMPYLFTLGNVATLLGLLGTVIGLVRTFSGVGVLEASQKQALLSSGIATALNATAFGLMVAIPSMLAYGFLFSRINNMIDEIEHYSSRLLVLLRTGAEYFDGYSGDEHITTRQTPKRKEPREAKEQKEHKEHKEHREPRDPHKDHSREHAARAEQSRSHRAETPAREIAAAQNPFASKRDAGTGSLGLQTQQIQLPESFRSGRPQQRTDQPVEQPTKELSISEVVGEKLPELQTDTHEIFRDGELKLNLKKPDGGGKPGKGDGENAA